MSKTNYTKDTSCLFLCFTAKHLSGVSVPIVEHLEPLTGSVAMDTTSTTILAVVPPSALDAGLLSEEHKETGLTHNSNCL